VCTGRQDGGGGGVCGNSAENKIKAPPITAGHNLID